MTEEKNVASIFTIEVAASMDELLSLGEQRATMSTTTPKVSSSFHPYTPSQMSDTRTTRKSANDGTAVDLDDLIRQRLAQKLAKMPAIPVVIKLQKAEDHSDSNLGFLRRICIIILSSVVFTVVNALLMAVPISKVAMAVIFAKDCPAEPLIGVFLLVDGGVALLRDIWSLVMKLWMNEQQYEKHEKDVSAICLFLISLETVWFIGGSVIVYKTMSAFQSENDQKPDYCNQIFYWYAFWVVTITYMLWAAVVLCIAILVLILWCVDDKPQEKEITVITFPKEGMTVTKETGLVKEDEPLTVQFKPSAEPAEESQDQSLPVGVKETALS